MKSQLNFVNFVVPKFLFEKLPIEKDNELHKERNIEEDIFGDPDKYYLVINDTIFDEHKGKIFTCFNYLCELSNKSRNDDNSTMRLNYERFAWKIAVMNLK